MARATEAGTATLGLRHDATIRNPDECYDPWLKASFMTCDSV